MYVTDIHLNDFSYLSQDLNFVLIRGQINFTTKNPIKMPSKSIKVSVNFGMRPGVKD